MSATSTRGGSQDEGFASPIDEDLAPPIVFNFGPQEAAAPEKAYFEAYVAAPEKMRMPKGARDLNMLLNRRRRAATNRKFRGGASASIDKDTSGNYDPKQERQTPSIPVRRVKKSKASALGDERNPKLKKSAKGIGWVRSLVVKLPFKSKKALDYLRSVPTGELGLKLYQSTDEEEESDAVPDSGSGSGRTSKRKRSVKRPARPFRSDGLTVDDLTDGHPQRRGCTSCFDQDNDECSLIDNHTYPCEACEDAGTDCILIVPPAFRKSCEQCKKKRRSCSYRLDGGKGVEACDACGEDGVTCYAAPILDERWVKRLTNNSARKKGSRSEYASSSVASDRTPIRERIYVSCNQCRSTGKRCQNCQFVYPPTRTAAEASATSKAEHKETAASSSKHRWSIASNLSPGNDSRDGTPDSPSTLTATLYGELERKNVKKARKLHDEGKQYLLSPSLHLTIYTFRKSSISLYSNENYNQRKKVEGFWYPDGGGFEEIFGGYSEDGYSRSSMCVMCTFERMRVTQCGGHRMRMLDPLKGEIDMRVFDDEKWSQATRAYTTGGDGNLVRKTKWCAVCPATATMMCCAPQRFDAQGDSRYYGESGQHGGCNGAGEEGCGLCLCEDCAVLLEKMVKGGARTGGRQIDALVNHVRCNTWRYPEGVRADASFITSSGELLKRIEQGMGIADYSQTPSSLRSSTRSQSQQPSERKDLVFGGISGGYGGPQKVDLKGKSKAIESVPRSRDNDQGKEKASVVDMVRKQLSYRQLDPAPAAEKGFMTSGSGEKSQALIVKIKKERVINVNQNGMIGREGREDDNWGKGKGRRWAEERREHRGEILRGGVLEPTAADVARAMGGQDKPVDSTDVDGVSVLF
ncbi:uncharacterized protein L3040_006840 [Drepanopeziza brunnea f. sp. 'multigermtubi']|uniref:uncharacterized protein n=1 Tax=Drepanopeziza brunnea f. sp. 'multigermtubi' TaxID=698441 RepID=UPI0023958424|nr:hypothetical protein L3040_006840 [Drepanopeziza brunnea f. sp. 'multigermtubi']